MADEFLKKVYDKYISSDYKYGTSNLNPKREISKVSVVVPKSDEDEILAKIKSKLDEIRAVADKLDRTRGVVGDSKDNNNFRTPAGPDNQSDGFNEAAVGAGGLNSPIFIPGITDGESDLDALERQIVEMILRLAPYLSDDIDDGKNRGGSGGDGKPGNPFDEIGSPFALMMNCDGLSIDDGDNSDEDDENTDDGSGDDNDGDNDRDIPPEGGVNLDDVTTALDDAASESEKELASCALQSLALLKVILIILKVIKTIKDTLVMVMGILVPTIKIATRIAGCWINPPSAGEAIQLIVEEIEGIITQMIGMILQAIWDSLQLDCLTSAVQSILDEINATLAGIDGVIAGVGETVKMVGDSYQQLVEAGQELEKAIKDIDFNEAKDNWKEFGKSIGPEAKEKFKNSSFANPKQLLKNSIPPAAIDAYRKALQSSKDLVEKTENITKKLTMGQSTGFSAAAGKALAALEDLEVL